MLGKLKLKYFSTLLIVLFMQLSAFAYAQGGEQASSPGIPGQKPLHLSSATLADGGSVQNATDVPTEPKFILQFDKNVVNSVIWAGNSKCFSLISIDNETIPVSVTKVDDTIDVSQKHNIFVQPANPLRPGTTYYLKISPEFKAKNGVTLGEGVTIAFKTKGEAPVQPLQPAQENTSRDHDATAANAAAPQERSKENENRLPAATGGEGNNPGLTPDAIEQRLPDSDDKPRETSGYFASRITTIGLFLVAGWIVFEILIKRKAKK